ncbi:MgtE protein [Cohnella lubricantis]|uniref:MgtE protein n=1 Tax=Cohnella lubricantis TaxID=2163172 RepID=A0A841TD78_9BACL|nr:MgtE protein [Cohnella lubricantis]MBB6679413.1 MgtE protein [Cohnella lubricantis]MBP2117495.1 flagellar motility protein MotE (MotC chaperone) [Cohnella lubricantis]
MPDTNAEKSGYSGFERFLFFLTPILFTVVLLGVLLILFNSDWRQSALNVGNKIPILNAVLPDPDTQAPGEGGDALTVDKAREKIDEANAQVLALQTQLEQEQSKTAAQQKTIDDQKKQVDELTQQLQDKSVTAEQYDAKIRSLADMYGKMTGSKAAPILEKMTVEEAALILGAMSDTARGRILEKMTPKVAADVTLRLKDSNNVQDQEIAALQARIKQLEEEQSPGSTLDIANLKTTFSTMQPDSAAELLLEMSAKEQSKVLRILSALDDANRSQVLAAMSKLSDDGRKTAAALVSKLMPANP